MYTIVQNFSNLYIIFCRYSAPGAVPLRRQFGWRLTAMGGRKPTREDSTFQSGIASDSPPSHYDVPPSASAMQPLSIQSPGGTSSTFEVHVTSGPFTTRAGEDESGLFAFHDYTSGVKGGKSNDNSAKSHTDGKPSKSHGNQNHGVNRTVAVAATQGRETSPFSHRGGSDSARTTHTPENNSDDESLTSSGQRRQEQLGLLGKSSRAVTRLWRPFGRVHHIVGDEEEMSRHPSLMHRAPTARVTRFFLWRKWTIIVIILQMYVQVGVDIRNFSIFMQDPYESLCPCRDAVKAREAAEAEATRASRANLATRSALGVATLMAAVRGSPLSAARYAAQAQQYHTDADRRVEVPSWDDMQSTLQQQGVGVNENVGPSLEVWRDVLLQPDGSLLSPEEAYNQAIAHGMLPSEDTAQRLQKLYVSLQKSEKEEEKQGGRRLQAQAPRPGTPPGREDASHQVQETPSLPSSNDSGDTTAGTDEFGPIGSDQDLNPNCDICDSVATVARTGMLPACYKYHASPGFNQVVDAGENDAKIGLLAFRTVNSTRPISLIYQCNGTDVGKKSTTCFQDSKLLLKRDCTIGFDASEYVTVEMSAVLARLTYAPSLTMRWADCDPDTHVQTREKVCLSNGKMVALGYCEAAGLEPPVIERECCLGSEDIFDTVYNQDYNNLLIFFDVVALVVSFSRLIATHLALYFIDSHKMSAIFVVWAWAVPFLGAFIKYSYPLNGFVSESGRDGAIEFMASLTGSEYVNNKGLTQAMAEAMSRSGGYDPILLYLMNLVDALRSYAVYGQAFVVVTIEFYYRFLYALMVLGELGPLAISVLPGFRSAAVVLKTLLPESATLGWLVSVGPMVYMPFLACALIMFIQVFSDYWFTLSSLSYSLSNLVMIVFFWRNSGIYIDPVSFRKQLIRQDMIRNVLLAASFAFAMVFMVESSRRESQGAGSTMRTIGPAGFLSFVVRCVLNFQLASVFSADVVLYLLRRLQRQARQDRSSNMEYERALKEFWVLDELKDLELEMRGDSIDISASASAAVAELDREGKQDKPGQEKKRRPGREGEKVSSGGEEEREPTTPLNGWVAAVVEMDGGGGRGAKGREKGKVEKRNASTRPSSVHFSSSSPNGLGAYSDCSSPESPEKLETGTTPLRGKRA